MTTLPMGQEGLIRREILEARRNSRIEKEKHHGI